MLEKQYPERALENVGPAYVTDKQRLTFHHWWQKTTIWGRLLIADFTVGHFNFLICLRR